MKTRITKKELIQYRKDGLQALMDYNGTTCRIVDANRGMPCVQTRFDRVWVSRNESPIFTRKMA